MDKIKNIYRDNYKEIIEFAKKAESLWENRVFHRFKKKSIEGIKLRKYLAPEGGYRIKCSQWNSLDEQLQSFFRNKIKQQNDWIYFRGYSYYSLDKVVHYDDVYIDNIKALEILAQRWEEYNSNLSIIEKLNNEELDFADYLAIISFLEWIWNDYSSITWVALNTHNQTYENKLMEDVDRLARVIVACTFNYLVNSESNNDYTDQFNILKNVFNDKQWKYILDGLWNYVGHQKEYVFRFVREGDQLWMVLVNVEFKLIPWMKKKQIGNILLLNNAFGAINIGYLIKYLCNVRMDVMNIYVSVHEEEMNRYTNTHNNCLKPFPNIYDYVVIVDDSIFTGRSVKRIKQIYSNVTDLIACLTMTYDVATYFNHSEEMDYDNNPLKSVLEVEREVRQMEGLLTPARSYWAYKKIDVTDAKDIEYEKNIKGSDLLIRILWRRFEKEIRNECN